MNWFLDKLEEFIRRWRTGDVEPASQEWTMRIITWNESDQEYLVNHNLGWVSHDQQSYHFNTKEDMETFQKYLTS